jgi:UDP-GlcNAc:undecaprenyl-phosphate/decaprenyl-phosphate GlcNAc-1-phosphate transferase
VSTLWTAVFAMASAGIVSFVATPHTGRLALRWGVVDHPSQDPESHKQHSRATPYLGGMAISLGLLAGVLLLMTVAEGIPVRHFTITIGAGIGLALVGLVDDITPLPRSLRLVAQIMVAAVAWQAGFGVTVGSDPLNLALTVFWIVGVTNAFNLLDNMDGVSAGLAGIAATTFAVMGILNELPLVPVVAAALAGACFGFLAHNRHPAKVFMGDSGSLLIGFLVALLGVRLRFEQEASITFLVPVIVVGIPVVDTTLVVISRLRHRHPVFLGARDHIAHRLVVRGASIRSAVRVMYGTALALAVAGVVMSEASTSVGYVLLGACVGGGLVCTWLLLRIPVYETNVARPRRAEDLAPSTRDEQAG